MTAGGWWLPLPLRIHTELSTNMHSTRVHAENMEYPSVSFAYEIETIKRNPYVGDVYQCVASVAHVIQIKRVDSSMLHHILYSQHRTATATQPYTQTRAHRPTYLRKQRSERLDVRTLAENIKFLGDVIMRRVFFTVHTEPAECREQERPKRTLIYTLSRPKSERSHRII